VDSLLPQPAGCLVPIIYKVAAGYPADFNDLDYPAGVADDYVSCTDVHDPNALRSVLFCVRTQVVRIGLILSFPPVLLNLVP